MIWLIKYKKIFLISLFSFISLNSYSFKLQNIYFNQRMDGENGGYREFYITNDYLTRQRYKVNILPVPLNDGAKFIEVYPKVITIDPQSKGTVKVFAKAPQNIKKGEYAFNLQFQPINIPTLAKNRDGITAGTSNIGVAPIIELKGYIGDIKFDEVLEIEDIKVEKSSNKGVVVNGNLSNTSYASIDFGIEAYGNNNFLYGSSYVGNISGNTKNKKIRLSFPMIGNPKDLKKIVLYRTPSNVREVIKEIKLEK
ncbi:hypothetical protein [Cetobacterium sp.]|uniref:hypothetical protein n=1 Tax=Cetobacterium sp. TaxID=2071632 RepID=UPI003F2A78D5